MITTNERTNMVQQIFGKRTFEKWYDKRALFFNPFNENEPDFSRIKFKEIDNFFPSIEKRIAYLNSKKEVLADLNFFIFFRQNQEIFINLIPSEIKKIKNAAFVFEGTIISTFKGKNNFRISLILGNEKIEENISFIDTNYPNKKFFSVVIE